MVDVTFYGGVGEIGGNIILLRDADTRLFLDFGKNFRKERQYFDWPLLVPREEKHLLDLGILPRVPGIYKKDAQAADVAGVAITHGHTDHYDYIRFLKNEIPIYCSSATRQAILGREHIGSSPSVDYEIAGYTASTGARLAKQFVELPEGAPLSIAGIQVEAVRVDHSAVGATGLIVHTSQGAIVYSGDFKWHGRRPELTDGFVQRAEGANPRAMIIEGTNIVSARPSTEQEVEDALTRVIEQASGLVMAGFSPVDMERLRTFHSVARTVNRVLVLSFKQGFMIDQLGSEAPVALSDTNVALFRREKKTS
jgi:ribonuclease J